MTVVFDAFQRAEWATGPEPEPLVAEAEKSAVYPVEALGPLRSPVEAIAKIVQAPVAVAAQSVLSVAALATQGFADVEGPGASRAPISLFCMSVALSGDRKSKCDSLAKRGVERYEAGLRKLVREEQAAFRNASAIWKGKYDDILKGAKADALGAENDLRVLGDAPEPPLMPSIQTSSPTIEGITKNMHQLRPSLGVFSDEGGAFLGGYSMRAENRAAAFAELSGLWDGTPVTRWRGGDGVVVYAGRRLSCHLMVQPVVAASLLADPLAAGQGILARFLLTAPESLQGGRDWGAEPDPSSWTAVDALERRILDLLLADLPLRDGERSELEPRVLPLSMEARGQLVDAGNRVERDLRPGGLWADVRPAANKIVEQACRIAGVMTIFDDPSADEVSEATFRDALTIALYHLDEARRLVGAAEVSVEMSDAERLRTWLTEKWDEEFVSAAEVTKFGPNAFRDTKRARALLKTLAQFQWLAPCDKPTAVRGKVRREAYRVRR